MPYYLRAIYNNTKWDKSGFPEWLTEGDLPSCIVKDLSAANNELSLWEITDSETNLMQVITAIASQRQTSKDNFDYALLNTNYIDSINFTCLDKNGTTPYSDINSFHRDLSNLSLQKLMYFAFLLFKFGKFRRVLSKELKSSIQDAAKGNKLDLSKVPKPLKQELGINY